MRGMTLLAAVGLTLLLLETSPDPVARGDDQVVTCTKAGDCTNIARREGQRRRWIAPKAARRTREVLSGHRCL
jgi:hypothetical protein